MHTPITGGWSKRGFSILWGTSALAQIARLDEVVSVRGLLALAQSWPEVLPSGGGRTLVVAGIEGCLDAFAPSDAMRWLEEDLKARILGFQEHYEGGTGLVLWIPGGKPPRITMDPAKESYSWACAAPHGDSPLPLGRILWGGAENDVRRILDPANANQDPDGPAWIGLHHPRIS